MKFSLSLGRGPGRGSAKIAVIAILLAIAVGIGAFFLGKRDAIIKEPQAFVLSSRITPEMLLGSAKADITELVEVCPTRDWLVFTGRGRSSCG